MKPYTYSAWSWCGWWGNHSLGHAWACSSSWSPCHPCGAHIHGVAKSHGPKLLGALRVGMAANPTHVGHHLTTDFCTQILHTQILLNSLTDSKHVYLSLYLKGILYKHFTIKHDFLSNLVWHLNDILCFFKLH